MRTELRLSIASKRPDSLASDPLLSGVAAVHEHVLNVYYDTEDLALWRHGLALRTCWGAGRWRQSLEGAGRELAMAREVEGRAVDRTKLPTQGKVGKRLARMLDDRSLAAVFEVELQRSRWELALQGGARIEIGLERGSIRAATQAEPVRDLVLILQSGGAADLYDLALRLAARWPLCLEPAGPAARGYALLSAAAVAPRKASALTLPPDADAEAAFVCIARACLDQLHENLAATRAEQVEGVHQMRVALRRLRSCLRLFRSLIPKDASAELVAELRWLNGFLGPARDWDVFIEEGLLALGARFPDKRGLQRLQRRAEAIREAHYRALQHCLSDSRFHRLLLRLHGWLAGRRWRERLSEAQQQGLGQPVAAFARPLLARARRRVVKRGDAFARLSRRERHALRIRVKRLRYAVEFFASLYPATAMARYARAAGGLQDKLGALNDASVASRLLDEAGLGQATATRQLIEGWYACREDVQEQGFAKVWKRFRTLERPWKRDG